MWPFKTKEETEHEKNLRLEREKAELQRAKLEAQECDTDVLEAVKIRNIYNALRDGIRTEDEFDDRLRLFANKKGADYQKLATSLNAKHQLRMLEDVNDEVIDKLRKLNDLNKNKIKLLGISDYR